MRTHKQQLREWEEKRSEANYHLMPDEFKKWLETNPRPIQSEQEHREQVNKILKEAAQKDADRAATYCPLSKEPCKKNCVCYSPVKIYGIVYEIDEEPNIIGGYCACYALHGPGVC